MRTEIIMVGTELLLGDVVDTNAAFLGRILAENGIGLYQKTTVGDNFERICGALRLALGRSNVVLVSGGLGPTEDDITRECVAEVTGRPLEFQQCLYNEIEARFARFRRTMSANNRKQACLPRGAVAISNPNGTAPGLIVQDEGKSIICMPGVPHELEAMTRDSVLPYLRDTYGLHGTIFSRVLKVCGAGESRVDEAIGDLMNDSANPTVALLASPQAVKIRITAKAESRQAAVALIDPLQRKLEDRLPGLIMGVDDDTLEGVVNALLAERGWKLAVSEHNTGGVASRNLMLAQASQMCGSLSHIDGASRGPEGGMDGLAATVEQCRAQYHADCGLGIACYREEGISRILLVTPDGQRQWEVGYADPSAISQTRVAVVALEHVRRFLMGTE